MGNLISRRKIIKGGLISLGATLTKTSSAQNMIDLSNPSKNQSPVHLNNLLVDYEPVDKKYGMGLTEVTINDANSWNVKRESIIRRSKIILGEFPNVKSVDIEAINLSETQRDGYNEVKIKFPSGTGDFISGYLLIPDSANKSTPGPAILAMHSTGPGASQTVGIVPKENRCYGMELARRGYVVLATDTIAAGERIYPGYGAYYTDPFYEQFPQWSAMGKILFDHQRGLDYLCSLDIVDPNRLGCIGHSLGGYNAFFLQAFDARIKAAVSSCGFSPMGGTTVPFQFARNDWFVHFNPVCRDFIRTGIVPCDMHEIMALCVPRALFNYSAKEDSVFYPAPVRNGFDFSPWWKSVEKALNQVEKVYRINDVGINFVKRDRATGHDFPPDIREEAYSWLDSKLA